MNSGNETVGMNADLTGTQIAVYGMGKMGLPLAAVLADNGARVHGVDIDESVVTAINDGRAPVDEPGLDNLLAQYGGGKLEATMDGQEAASKSDVMIVLVPTILDEHDNPALETVLDVARDISTGVSEEDLIILESTAPPGTTEGPFREAVESDELTAGEDFRLAHCPERTSSGRVIQDLTEAYPKIVGGIDEESTEAAASLYRVINDPGVIEMSSATAAEAVKVFEGIYRDVNIALANELAKASHEWELDAIEVFQAANSQPYCNIHDPGIGVGGHCIPVYPHFVMTQATETPLLETARNVNQSMPGYAINLLKSMLADEGLGLDESNILVLGLTYRPGVKELRYAPALTVIEYLNEANSTVYAHDPLIDLQTIEENGAVPVDNPISAEHLDGIVLATGHDVYNDLDLGELRAGMRTPILVDGRNFFETNDVDGFRYTAIGDGKRSQV